MNPLGGLRETGGLLFSSRKGALTHHPEGQWYFLRKSCALRGGCGWRGRRHITARDCAGGASRQTIPEHRQVLLSSSAQVAVVSALETACTLPAQTCHRQLCLRLCPKLIFGAFSLLRKRNRKRKNEVKKIWRFIIWKRRWSAGAQAAPQ